jgi:hypothetical protein
MILSTLTEVSTPLNVHTMDCGFKYKPYVPKKRSKVVMTSKGSFVQKFLPLFNHGDGTVDWEISTATAPVARTMYNLYNLDDNFTFNGAYGEEYLVEFIEIKPNPEGGPWSLKGKFRVLCVISELEPDFQCQS